MFDMALDLLIVSKFNSRANLMQYTYILQKYRSIFKNARHQLEDQSNLNAKLTYSIFELLLYASQNHIKLHTATLFPPPYARRNCISKTISLFKIFAALSIEQIRTLRNIAFYSTQRIFQHNHLTGNVYFSCRYKHLS